MISLNNWIAAIIIESNKSCRESEKLVQTKATFHSNENEQRLDDLYKIIEFVLENTESDGVILFPGGWLNSGKEETRTLYGKVEQKIKTKLDIPDRHIIVCFGIDGKINGGPEDQIGIAISKNGIEAIGRKFYPAPQEKRVALAKSYLSEENGKPRFFELRGKKYYIAVCYDVFGIRKDNLPNNLGIDVILNVVHGFCRKGEGMAGDAYFAKWGFAGASKGWGCYVFGATIFFKRQVPRNWPSAVYWNQGEKDVRLWRYQDNPIRPRISREIKIKEGKAILRVFY